MIAQIYLLQPSRVMELAYTKMQNISRKFIYDKDKEEIIRLINLNTPKARICELFSFRPITLDSYLKRWGIVYRGNQGAKSFKTGKKISAIDYINSGRPVSSHRLKLKILANGLRPHKCETCGITMWNNKPVPLELHHIDGNRFNNSLDNVELDCPNCHAQKPNNSGSAVKIKNKIRSEKI